jgi:hypothetical protein
MLLFSKPEIAGITDSNALILSSIDPLGPIGPTVLLKGATPMSFRPALLILAMATTAACGADNITRKPVVSSPSPTIAQTRQFPARPAFTASDFNAAVADDKRAGLLDETRSSVIPFGRATYDGHVRSSAIINNDSGYDVIGDLTLDVDINSRSSFANRNPITGRITDVTVTDRQSDDLLIPLAGRLDISGDSTSGELEATATGILARDRGGIRDEEAAWSINLDGSFRDDFTSADVVTGTATGGTTGGSRDDYNVALTDNGRFYGEAQ